MDNTWDVEETPREEESQRQPAINRPEPNEPSVPDPLDDLNINTDSPPQAEGETATKAVKNGKASGIDSLDAEFIT